MRLVFLLLLLANLGVLAWYGWIAAPGEPGDVQRGAVQEDRLALVGESTAEPTEDDATPADAGSESPQENAGPDSAAEPDAEAPGGEETGPETPGDIESETGAVPAPEDGGEAQETGVADTGGSSPSGSGETGAAGPADRLCVSYGPFPTEERAAAAGARLQRAGLAPERRETEGRLRVGYWVYLPALPSEEEAEAVTEKLRDNGFEDFYIVRSGENENAVSLGVFSDTGRADSRAARIGQMGLKPRITDRYREATVFWLDVSAPPRKLPPAEAFRQYVGSAGDIHREERECPAD